MPFSRSRSIESMTRSATSWLARNAPDCQSIWSTSVVLPWSTWATIATLRRSSRTAIGFLRVRGVGQPTEVGHASAHDDRDGTDAVAAVDGGTAVADAAAGLVASDDRRRAPRGASTATPVLGRARRPRAPAATTGGRSSPPASTRLGHPRLRVQRRPARRRHRQRHLLPGHDGAGRHVGRRPRGAHRRRDRPGAAGPRRRPLRRRVRQPAPPPGVGPGPGDLRRGPAPRRRAGRRAHPGRAAPRHGHA